MPKREPVIKSVSKTHPISVDCEWETCTDHFTEINSYLEHVTKHLQSYLVYVEYAKLKEPVEGQELAIACYWRGCNHGTFSDFNMTIRHLYFHAFHTKLKSTGNTMMTKNNFGKCYQDPSQVSVIPDLPDRLACGWDFCTGVFDNPQHFYSHVANHCDVYPSGNNVEGGCKCQWEGCTTLVKSKHKLKDHMHSHTQEKVVACPTCGALFSNMTRFYDHIKRQVTAYEVNQNNYECSHCNKQYATERLLKDHMRRHVNYYQCPFCEMTCPNPSNLRLHFRYRHSNARPFVCTQCNHTSKTQYDLNRHMDTHENWIYCNDQSCDYRCHSLSDLNRHSKLVHEMTEGDCRIRFLCHLCGVSYTKGTNLTSHLREKHKFRWPPGHVRFRYTFCLDGFYKLQTVRYESIELTQQALVTDIPASPEQLPAETPERPRDIYDDVVINDSEVSAKAGGDYSYNLDLLGNVALNDSVKESEQEAEEVLKSVKRTGKGEKRKRKSDGSQEPKEKASRSKKQTRKKSKENNQEFDQTVAQMVVVEPASENAHGHLETCLGPAASNSGCVVDLHMLSNDGMDSITTEDSNGLVQTILLPSGEQVLITSNVPVQFADPIDMPAAPDGNTYDQSDGLTSPRNLTPSKYTCNRRLRPTLEEKIQELVANKSVITRDGEPFAESLMDDSIDHAVQLSAAPAEESLSSAFFGEDSLGLDHEIGRELRAAVRDLDF